MKTADETGFPPTLPVPTSLKVWAASWFYDGSAPGPAKTGYGNNCYVMSSKQVIAGRTVDVRLMSQSHGGIIRSRSFLGIANDCPGRSGDYGASCDNHDYGAGPDQGRGLEASSEGSA